MADSDINTRWGIPFDCVLDDLKRRFVFEESYRTTPLNPWRVFLILQLLEDPIFQEAWPWVRLYNEQDKLR